MKYFLLFLVGMILSGCTVGRYVTNVASRGPGKLSIEKCTTKMYFNFYWNEPSRFLAFYGSIFYLSCRSWSHRTQHHRTSFVKSAKAQRISISTAWNYSIYTRNNHVLFDQQIARRRHRLHDSRDWSLRYFILFSLPNFQINFFSNSRRFFHQKF